MTDALVELEHAVGAALETYSNVHRGSGHHSVVSTHLFEQARTIVLGHLGLDPRGHAVVFCTPRAADKLVALVPAGSHRLLSSQDVGLSLGVRAVVVSRGALPGGVPFQAGGGTARLVGPGWVVWARAPERFEAGTPAIVNVIAFAKALRLVRERGTDALGAPAERSTAAAILRGDELLAHSGRALLDELRHTLVGRGICAPTLDGPRPYVNLDNAASTPTFEPIWSAVRRAWRQPAEVQRQIVAEVRSICAEVLGAPAADYEVAFTANTTEAINVVADGLRRDPQRGVEPVVVNTLLEHNSNELPWRTVAGAEQVRLPVDQDGFVDPRALEALLRAHNEEGRHGARRIRLVAVSGASNVLGTCNDLEEIARIVHRHDARLLVDAAQLVAHRRIEVAKRGIDYLAFSGHKVYAPFGAGVLLARKGLLGSEPSEVQRILASGEENVAGIAALGTSLLLLQRIGFDVIQEEEQELTRRALRSLATVRGLRVHGVADPASPSFARRGGVVAFSLKGAMADRIASGLAERGIGIRAGCHCAHLLVKSVLGIPRPLESFQRLIVTLFPRLELPGVARLSLGLQSTEGEIDTLVQALHDLATRRSRHDLRPRDVRRHMAEASRTASQRVYGPPPPAGHA